MERTHEEIVLACYEELKKSKNQRKVLARYGRKTGEEAWKMYIDEKAKEKGMTVWEYAIWTKNNG